MVEAILEVVHRPQITSRRFSATTSQLAFVIIVAELHLVVVLQDPRRTTKGKIGTSVGTSCCEHVISGVTK